MENLLPPSRRVLWLALTTLAILLVLPSTRTLLNTQMQMEALTYATQMDLPAERAAAARLPNDYPVQLALAIEMPTTIAGIGPGAHNVHTISESAQCDRNILALARRFPHNPSVYANLLRYMTRGEMHLQRKEDGSDLPPRAYRPAEVSPESVAMFVAAAQKGAEVDPDNAYFPMMQTVGLLAAHRDSEALDAFKTAGRCSRWAEYYQDDVEGRNRLQAAAYGDHGAMPRLNNAANLLLPQYSQLRTAARVAVRLTAQREMDGGDTEMVAVRHAIMRCGGLMRSQGSSYITTLVGIAIANIATSDPLDMPDPDSLTSGHNSALEMKQHQKDRRSLYYGYLEGMGRADEAAWARTELAAGDQTKSIGKKALESSVFNGPCIYQLGLFHLINVALLSSALVLAILGSSAHLAGHFRPRKALILWRSVSALALVGGIGYWQWRVAQINTSPFVEIQRMFAGMTENAALGNTAFIQSLAAGLSLLVPVLFVNLLVSVGLSQRVPLVTALGRGLRGAAVPVAACLFLLYGASLLPTVYAESALKTQLSQNTISQIRCFAEATHKALPGDPLP